eukprot:m.1358429 g.1358429  ORF g.1358429 m.1358429 type:complete len:1241 (-) comp24934_c1_seq42:2153-5875(-)
MANVNSKTRTGPAFAEALVTFQQWIEDGLTECTTQNVREFYRIDAIPCKSDGACKRNCKANPKCLRHLGEKKWRELSLGTNKRKRANTDADDRSLIIREVGAPSGLVNLGATCYVNSLLQIWFHNKALREAVYRWRPRDPGMSVENGEHSLGKNEIVMSELQRVFAFMECSNACAHNPEKFIDALSLSHTVQQDGQEFARLFMNILEQELPSPHGFGSIVAAEFGGAYTYVTTCSTCHTASSRRSPFYELELQTKGKVDLLDCISEYFSAEQLNENNQYACSTCGTKRDAVRELRIVQLPTVLSFHLLRFDYDLVKGTKTKIKDVLAYPDMLSIEPYCDRNLLTTETEEVTYELEAILIHRGPNASSGHYGAQLHVPSQHKRSDASNADASGKRVACTSQSTWWEFDDEVAKKVPVTAGHPVPSLGELAVGDPRCKAVSKSEKQKAAAAARQATLKRSASHTTDDGESTLSDAGNTRGDGDAMLPPGKRHCTSVSPATPTSPAVPTASLHFSKNVYMLTYRRRKRSVPATNDASVAAPDGDGRVTGTVLHRVVSPRDTDASVPHHLREEIAAANAERDVAVQDAVRRAKQRARDATQLGNTVFEQYTALCPDAPNAPDVTDAPNVAVIPERTPPREVAATQEQSALAWVPTAWIEAWLKQSLDEVAGVQPPDVDNRTHTCPHGRLDPLKVRANKLVAADALRALLAHTDRTRYTPLDGAAGCCSTCVDGLFAEVQRRRHFELLHKSLKALGAFGGRRFVAPTEGMVVAKTALRSLNQKLPPNVQTATGASDADEVFNAPVRCKHGHRSISEHHMTIVSCDVWQRIEAFFGPSNVVAIPSTVAPCEQCLEIEHGAANARRSQQEEAMHEKEILPSMFQLASGRPGIILLLTGEAKRLYVLPTEFTVAWRQWCKSRTPRADRPRPTGINFSPLLCTCGGNHVLIRADNLLRHAGVDASGTVTTADMHTQRETSMVFPCPPGTRWRNRDFFELVTEAEWATLAALYPRTSPVSEIFLERHREHTPGVSSRAQAPPTPPSTLSNGAGLTVAATPNGMGHPPASSVPGLNSGEDTPCTSVRIQCNLPFRQACFDAHLALQNASVEYKLATLWVRKRAPSSGATSSCGSSVRQRRSRGGCKKIVVDSTDTLRELRVKIMNIYNVLPSDQRIFWRGQELVDSTATLGLLGISEHDEIDVEVDNTIADDSCDAASDALEIGFSGTLLSSTNTRARSTSTTSPPIVIDD